MKRNRAISTNMTVAIFAIIILIGAAGYWMWSQQPKDNGDDEPEPLNEDLLVPEIRLNTFAPSYDPIRYESTLLVAEAWEELGFDVNVVTFPDLVSYYDTMRVNWAWEASWMSNVMRASRIDPDDLLRRLYSRAPSAAGEPNDAGYVNSEYDDLYEQQRGILDMDERKVITDQLQWMAVTEAPNLFLYHRISNYAYNNERFENYTVLGGSGFWSVWNNAYLVPKTDDTTFVVGRPFDIATLNPLVGTLSFNWYMLRNYYDTLTKTAPDLSIQPWIATSWEVIDSLTVDFTIREGVTFHDGVPLTAEDVAFSYNYMIEWNTPSWAVGVLANIDNVEVLDSNKVRFHMANEYAPMYYTATSELPILPKHIWENIVEEEGLSHPDDYINDNPIGSGAFKVVHWRPNEELLLEKNDDHWTTPQVNVLFRYFASTEAVFEAMKSGNIDTHGYNLLPDAIDALEDVEFITVDEAPDAGIHMIQLNQRWLPFKDLETRQALLHTVDYDTIINTVLRGYGGPDGGYIVPPNKFWHNADLDPLLETTLKFDLAEARDMLEDLGYQWDEDGRIYYPEAFLEQYEAEDFIPRDLR